MKKLVWLLLACFCAGRLTAQWTPRSLQVKQIKRPDFFLPLSLHFSDSSNGFLLNSGALMQYRQGAWYPAQAGDPNDFTYTAVFTVNPRQTFLCSADGRVARRDEAGNLSIVYSIPPESGANPALNTLYMTDSLSGWAAGDGGTLVQLDGENSSLLTLNPDHYFKDICFDAPGHGWLIGYTQSQLGNFGVLYEYTGGQWTFKTLLDETLYDIEFAAPGIGFIAGENALYRYNAADGLWEAENLPGYQRQLDLSLLNENYGLGVSDNSSTLVYRNGSWEPGPAASGITDLVSVWVTGEGKAWAVSQFGTGNPADYNEGKIQQLNDNSWQPFSLSYLNTTEQLPVNYAITSLTGLGKKELWINGQYLKIPENSDWPAADPVLQSDTFCNAARLFSREFGLGTDGDVKAWNGNYWLNQNLDPVDPDTSYSNLSMAVFNDTSAFICRQRLVWASGAILSQVSRYQYSSNSLSSTVALDSRFPFGIHFYDAGHGWVVGDSGLTARYRLGSWELPRPVTDKRLNAVAVTDTNAAWAVGDEGTLLYFNGTGWVTHPLPTVQNLHSIRFAGGKGWITGDSGLIFRYEAPNWVADSSGTTQALYSLYMVDSTWGFAGGENGTFLQYRKPPAAPPTRQFCENGNSYFSYHPATGSGYSFQWQVDTGTGYTNILPSPLYSGIQADTLRLLAMPPSLYGYRYRCIASLNGVDSVSNEEVLRFVTRWTGAVSEDWEDAGNWSCGALPGRETDVEIEAGEIRLSSPVSIRSLRLGPAVEFKVREHGELTILH